MKDEDLIKAAEWLRHGWPDMIGEDSKTMAKLLDDSHEENEEAVHQTAERIKDLLNRHPQVQEKLKDVTDFVQHRYYRGGYQPAPGGPDDVPAGTDMVCPVDPDHYCKPLRQKGRRLFCPVHQVELIPAVGND